MLVRVRDFWLNPDMVVGVWHDEIKYESSRYEDHWRVTLRCEEGQIWEWKFTGDNAEEEAVRRVDEVAAQINASPPSYPLNDPWSQSGTEPPPTRLR